MNWSGNFLAAFLILFSIASANAQTDTDTSPYYNEESRELKMSQVEYEDLKTYVQRAQEILERTLHDAESLSGNALHSRLYSGINSALKESALRADLVIFRYVLLHAIELDRLFGGSAYSARHVLLPHIQSALKYYKSDDFPRLKSAESNSTVTSPDWVKFAGDQIPVLLKIANLAPSDQVKVDIVKYSLIWTARSLNSSFDRRDRATQVVPLAEMLERLTAGPEVMAEAQQLLLGIGVQLNPDQKKSGDISFPVGNYPATAPNGPRGPVFPLSGIAASREGLEGPFVLVDKNTYDDFFAEKIAGRINAGVIFQKIDANNDNGSAYGAVSGSMRSLIFNPVNKPNLKPWVGPTAGMDGKISVGVGDGGATIYNVKIKGYAGELAPIPVGLWLAVEANNYDKFSEQYFRFGVTHTLPIKIGEESYILVRPSFGGAVPWTQVQNGVTQTDPIQALLQFGKHKYYSNSHSFAPSNYNLPFYYELSAMLKCSKFFLNVEVNHTDWHGHSDDELGNRTALSMAMTIPLGMIFKNDAIQVDGDYVHFDWSGTTVNVEKVGVMYELFW